MAKTLKFEIETYTVRVNQSGNENTNVINLVSTDQSHGIRFKATVLFFPKNPYAPETGQMKNIGGVTLEPIGLSAFVDRSAFAGFYQVLSSEKPVSLEVQYEDDPSDPKSTFKYINRISLLTGDESPGDFEKLPVRFIKPIVKA